jgi:hypothetical protein
MNVNPYISHESRRLRLVQGDVRTQIVTKPKLAIASLAEYRASDYRFARTRGDRLPLEKSPPLQSDGERLLRGLLCALSISAALALIALVV